MRAWLSGCALWITLGCRPTSPPADEPGASPAEEAQTSDTESPLAPPGFTPPAVTSGPWLPETQKKIVLVTQSLVLNLPYGDAWDVLPRRGTWSGLGHAETASEIWVRHASARRTVTLDECEAEARLSWETLRDGSEVAVSRALHSPAGYGGTARVLLLPDGGGRIEAFSVGVSRCLAVVFITGEKPGFPERLQAVMNDVLPRLRVPSIDERGTIKRT